jgi:drug/metabolite transporter (DMT)-like permease
MTMNQWALMFLLAALWSPSFLFIKIGLHDVPPLTLAASRLGIGAVLLYILMRVRGEKLPRDPRMWRHFMAMGFFSGALPFALISMGETTNSSSIAAIFNGATPIATALLAHFFIADERLTPKKLAGVLIGFAGIVTIFLPGLLAGGTRAGVWGMAGFTLAAMSYGAGAVYARRNLRGLGPLVGPTTQLGCGALMLWPFALGTEWGSIHAPGLPALGAVLFLAIFGTALAYVVFYRMVETSSATFLSLVTYLLPPAGIVLGIIVLDEGLSWNAVAGCALVLVGVVTINDVVGGLQRRFRKREVATAGE